MTIVAKMFFWMSLILLFVFAAWYVVHGDIVFTSDIARDFFLFGEIAQKKIVLIGPRSSSGLFHGPLWMYLNFPAYLLGRGNPVIVGWWWVILSFLFLIPGFFVAKKLFNSTTAYCYTLLLAFFYAFNARGLFNPHGAMFVMPIFFYFFVTYIQNGKKIDLVGTMITLGALIQFEMADGIPFAILTILAFSIKIFQTKKYFHLLFFGLLGITLSNFIVFDLRHQHLLLGKVLDFVSPVQKGHDFNYFSLISDRISLLFTSPQILRRNILQGNTILFLGVLGGMVWSIKKKLFVIPYTSFLYLYGGFFFLSFLNKADLLYFYLFPLFPLVFLMVASLVPSYKKLFIPFFFFILLLNSYSAYQDMQDAKGFIGYSLNSWKFLHAATNKIFEGKDKSFGYFVYSPDVVAYEARYAMQYAVWTHPQVTADAYNKDAVTYLFVAPPPSNNPFMHDDWWRMNQLNIKNTPVTIASFPNGYKIQRLELSQEDQKVSFDSNINPGITFR